jgi:hypothetical protein
VSTEARSRGLVLIWMGALVLGFAVRAIPVTAARPYIAYVDEGNFLHSPFRLLKEGGWNPPASPYPQLPGIVVTAAARAIDPMYRAVRGVSLRDRIPAQIELYDELEPFGLLLLVRFLNVALGIALVVLTGLLARRLAGPRAGAAAAALAALTPALALRGSSATVDSLVTLWVLACLWLTDLTRTSRRAGLVSFGAGAMAGLAFASKYPSGIVLAAFGVTTLLLPIAGRERVRRLALAAAGLVAAAFLAMPAIRLSPAGAYASILREIRFYGNVDSPSLWRQALLRAEWDIPFEGAELGFVFTAAALAGIVLGLRDRDLRPTLWGWCTYAGIAFALFGTRTFQPFRNLLPLVPLGCVAAALLFVRIRHRVRRKVWIDAAALGWLLLAFGLPMAAYARDRSRLRDSRTIAVDWLTAHVQPGDDVLLVHDLGILRQEVDRVRANTRVRWWEQVESEVRSNPPRFIVGGVRTNGDGSLVEVSSLPAVGGAYVSRLRAGTRPTVLERAWWRGNDQIVEILERKD